LPEGLLRYAAAAVFLSTYGSLLLVALLELMLEERAPAHSIARRWTSNLALQLLNRTVVRSALPLGSFAAALAVEERGIGLLHVAPAAIPPLAAAAVTVLVLDLVDYGLHRVEHVVPLLWRLHRVHHADQDLDFSTAHRHHPLELIFGAAVRLAVVAAIGASGTGLWIYAVGRGVVDAFSHGNLRLPGRLDRALRSWIVTPAMHAVHHSAVREETDSNFTTLLSVWDRLFGTYREAPAAGCAGMTVGIEAFRTPRDLDLDRILIQPLLGDAAPAVRTTVHPAG
jgi:sterol desaturase/sphingolipid hydroxylase (fatty acid hydroxylase superfamily)